MATTHREAAFLSTIPPRREEMLQELKGLVDLNSFTGNKAGVEAVARSVEGELEALGFRCSALLDGVHGPSLVARRTGGGHRLLLIGHLDTVHRPDADFSVLKQDPQDPDRWRGPGSADMKGGIVVILEALRALERAGALAGRQLTVVLNSDEETGSVSSADLIRAEASESHLALGFEAGRPHPDGGATFVTRRRGFGRLTLEARGKAAHAGVDPGAGASALLELAHKAIALSALGDAGAGTSVTVGVLRGGTAANVVPEFAMLEVDYRFPDEDAREELEDAIYREAARNVLRSPEGRPLVATVIRDQAARPAMEETDAVRRMAARIVAWGADLGQVLVPEARGGSSDAALAAEAGCPAVCGLGAVGDAFHTDREWISAAGLVDRAMLAALTIDRFYGL